MSWLMDLGLFALLFFLLVFFHELGHFLMAKWVGIKVEKFSIGMGPKIFSFQGGETEYRLAWLPLGGYVKMSGDDPSKEYTEEEKRRGFLTQKPSRKLLVVFGGPVFNLILPIFIYSLMLIIGIPTVDRVVGTLDEGGAGAKAGLLSGDKILSIDGKEINQWKDMEKIVQSSANQELTLQVERLDLRAGKSKVFDLAVTPELKDGKSKFGEDIKVGMLGVSPAYLLPRIYFEESDGPLSKAGLQPFDQIVSVNSVKILSLDQFRRYLELNSPDEFEVAYKRTLESGKEVTGLSTVSVPAASKGAKTIDERLGLLPIELVIGQVSEDGKAYEAGVRKSDRLISIDGKMITKWEQVPEIIRASKGEALSYVFSRGGKQMSFDIAAEKTTIENPLLGKDDPLSVEEKYRIGVSPDLLADTSYFHEQSWSPIAWLNKGVTETWRMASMTVEALFKLVTGELSFRLLGSPIMIYKVAGNTYRMAGGGQNGWIAFLTNLALLSITLGLVNLLPIPVLDGGHAVFFTLEAIRGKPLSLKSMEIAAQVGLVILIGLFVLVIYNDFNRYGFLDPVFKLFQ